MVMLGTVRCGGEDAGEARPDPEVQCQRVTEGYGPPGTAAVDVEPVATGLSVPWSLGWLPSGEILMSERGGRLSIIDAAGQTRTIAEVALDVATMEGGLLGLAVHPVFEENRWFYVYYTVLKDGAVINQVERWVLSEDAQSAAPDRVVVDDIPALQFHNGGRLRFGPDGLLYVGTG